MTNSVAVDTLDFILSDFLIGPIELTDGTCGDGGYDIVARQETS